METPPNTRKRMSSTKFGDLSKQLVGNKKSSRKSGDIGIFCPSYSDLETNFGPLFQRFLKTLKRVTDEIDHQRNNILLPLEKIHRQRERRKAPFDLHFKSIVHWKKFCSCFVEHCDDIIKLFRFDDVREVDEAIESARLPKVLESFVLENLREWRATFANRKWMIEYRQSIHELERLRKELREVEEKNVLIAKIIERCQIDGIDLAELVEFKDRGEDLVEYLRNHRGRTLQNSAAEETTVHLKRLPVASKKNNTIEWCMKHHGFTDQFFEDNCYQPTVVSDDESTQSSICPDGRESYPELSLDEDPKIDAEDDGMNIDAFFSSSKN